MTTNARRHRPSSASAPPTIGPMKTAMPYIAENAAKTFGQVACGNSVRTIM